MLVICYGIAKSGSTLAFELVKGVLGSAGHSQKKVQSTGIKPKGRLNLLAEVTPEAIEDAIAAIGPDRIVAAKTHLDLPETQFSWFEKMQAERKLQVITSYRDPRDMCLSLIDHGARAREAGRHGFSGIHDLADASDMIEQAIRKFRKWSALTGSLRLSYETVAYSPDDAIDAIERTLGVTCDHEAAKEHAFEDARTLKNKAEKNRFEHELDERQKTLMLKRFGFFIERVCRDNDEQWFAECRAEMFARQAGQKLLAVAE